MIMLAVFMAQLRNSYNKKHAVCLGGKSTVQQAVLQQRYITPQEHGDALNRSWQPPKQEVAQ
jgi:20S proteasome alpha/beta subunit